MKSNQQLHEKCIEIFRSFEERWMCPVCRELVLEKICLSCGHSFCSACLANCSKIKILCPVCRTRSNSLLPDCHRVKLQPNEAPLQNLMSIVNQYQRYALVKSLTSIKETDSDSVHKTTINESTQNSLRTNNKKHEICYLRQLPILTARKTGNCYNNSTTYLSDCLSCLSESSFPRFFMESIAKLLSNGLECVWEWDWRCFIGMGTYQFPAQNIISSSNITHEPHSSTIPPKEISENERSILIRKIRKWEFRQQTRKDMAANLIFASLFLAYAFLSGLCCCYLSTFEIFGGNLLHWLMFIMVGYYVYTGKFYY